MSSEESRFLRIVRPRELTMSPSGILQRCFFSPAASRTPQEQNESAGNGRDLVLPRRGRRGGAGAYWISDEGGGGSGRRSGGRRVWTSMSWKGVWVVFGLAHHFRSAH